MREERFFKLQLLISKKRIGGTVRIYRNTGNFGIFLYTVGS